jgi:thymidine kinase
MRNDFLIFVGPMFGGKTTRLLSAIDRYRYQGRKIFCFKPEVDNRYSKSEIVTHTGGIQRAYRIKDANEIKDHLISWGLEPGTEDIVVAIDEAFMLPNAGDVLPKLFRRGVTVIVSSLQLSSDGGAYPQIQALLPYATKIEVCPAVCSLCSADAHYTEKIAGNLNDHGVEVGGSEMYQPRCFKHFSYVGNKEND